MILVETNMVRHAKKTTVFICIHTSKSKRNESELTTKRKTEPIEKEKESERKKKDCAYSMSVLGA